MPPAPNARNAAWGAALAYGAVLLSLPRWNSAGLAALTVGLAAVALWLWWRSAARNLALLSAWAPLHIALVLTGSLASPLLPLVVVWIALAAPALPAQSRRAGTVALALAAFVLVARGAVYHAASTPGAPMLARLGFVVAAGAALALLTPRQSAGSVERPGAVPLPPPDVEPGAPDVVLQQTLELARRAADAHEVTLWQGVDGEHRVSPVAWSAAPGTPPPAESVPLAGHPFGWAVDEQVHVQLQRGRRVLPSPWAREMLLVPLAGAPRLLAFAYPAATPPGAEQAALQAGRHVAVLLRLLMAQADAERESARTRAVLDAVRTLPGVVQLDAFARHLAVLVRDATGAEGTAIVLASSDTGPARVLHVEAREGTLPALPTTLGDADSRLALTLKHGVPFSASDLRRQGERVPLLSSGERWRTAPRSVVLAPLKAEERTVGAVAIWHAEAGRFGERETSVLDLLCSLAPLPMRSASQYADLDRRASTDMLTGLPNRRTFDTRLVVASSAFDRYARPFSLIVIDVDHFKRFNDTWGHEAGDRVLQHVAELLRGTVRDVDLAARLGGEEFVVLLPEAGLRAASEAAERLRRGIEARTVVWNGRPLSVTISAGVASCPECTATPPQLLALADAALYVAKGEGRNRVSTAPCAAPASGTLAGPRR